MVISITNKALPKLKNIIKSHNVQRIMFGVKGGGCNGFEYVMEPTNKKPNKLDEVIKKNDVEIVVCSKSLFYFLCLLRLNKRFYVDKSLQPSR